MVNGDSAAVAINNATRLSVQLPLSLVASSTPQPEQAGPACPLGRSSAPTGGGVSLAAWSPIGSARGQADLEVGRRAVPWTGPCLRIGLASTDRKRGRNPIAVARRGVPLSLWSRWWVRMAA